MNQVGKQDLGKNSFTTSSQGRVSKRSLFYVAIITPVIHYCMGGLEIDVDSAVVDKDGKAIKGLYAAGEVAGGVHGNNRLGGNSLLDCVVFGRVAGQACAKHMLGSKVTPTSLAELSGGGLSGAVTASKFSGGSYEDNMNGAPAAASSAPKKEKKAKKAGGGGGYTMAEVQKHVTKTDCWVVLHNRVLNVTSFLSEHPGGELAILTFAGKDATSEFDMIHPPDVIEKYAPTAVIGMLGSGAPAGGADDADVEKGTGGMRAAGVGGGVRSTPAPADNTPCIQRAGRDCMWHLGQMDGCTWWMALLTVTFLGLVCLAPRPQ